MNKTAIYSTIVVSVIASLAVFAVSSSEVEAVPPFKGACPAENVQHWMNFFAQVANPLIHATEPDIPDDSQLYVQVSRDGSELFLPEFKQQSIADRLNELGYTQTDGDPVESSDIGGVDTRAGFIGYSTICAEN